MKRVFRFAFVLLIFFCTSQGQQADPLARFRLAQSLEQSGEWEKALRIYEVLHAEEPDNYVYYDRLRNAFIQLKNYPKAIALVELRLRVQPRDPLLMAGLGALYYRSGEERKADSIWAEVLRGREKDQQYYRILAIEMMTLRLFERTIQLYLQGRKELGDQTMYADELASLYIALQQYAPAVREFAGIIRKHPTLALNVRARMQRILDASEGLQVSLAVIREDLLKNGNDVQILFLLAWLHLQERNFSDAFEIYRTIDQLTKGEGRELMNFATSAFKEQQFEISLQAWEEVLQKYLRGAFRREAEFQRARCMEEIAFARDTVVLLSNNELVRLSGRDVAGITKVIDQYSLFIGRDTLSPYAQQALMRIALLKRDRLHDLDGAASDLRKLLSWGTRSISAYQAQLELADVLFLKNDLAKAKDVLNQSMSLFPAEYGRRARYRLAELDFYNGAFDEALKKLAGFMDTLDLDLANDAIELQGLISQFKNLPGGLLAELATAQRLRLQRKGYEALARMHGLMPEARRGPAAGHALLLRGMIFCDVKNYTEAVADFAMYADSLQQGPSRDLALMLAAELSQYVLKDIKKAKERYQQLLTAFPYSIYSERARTRIRQLRGDIS